MRKWNGLFQKKIQTERIEWGGWGGLRIWNFQGYQRNSMCNFRELTKNKVEFLRVIKKIWNFLGSLFLALEFPRDLIQFCGISRGWVLFCLEFPGVSKRLKKSRGFSKKHILSQPRLDFFWNSTIKIYWKLKIKLKK